MLLLNWLWDYTPTASPIDVPRVKGVDHYRTEGRAFFDGVAL